jgi:hypothetical protein
LSVHDLHDFEENSTVVIFKEKGMQLHVCSHCQGPIERVTRKHGYIAYWHMRAGEERYPSPRSP